MTCIVTPAGCVCCGALHHLERCIAQSLEVLKVTARGDVERLLVSCLQLIAASSSQFSAHKC